MTQIRLGLRCDSCGVLLLEELIRVALVPSLTRGTWMRWALGAVADHLVSCPTAKLLPPEPSRQLWLLCEEARDGSRHEP